MFHNPLIDKIQPYKLSSHKAWELENKDHVLKLDWNEATIPPSPAVIRSISELLQSGKMNWYPDVNNHELIEGIARYNNIPKENIQYFASSDSLHEYIVRCYVGQSDRILVLSPTYDNFRAVAESNGGQIQFYNLSKNFKLDFKQFSKDLQLIKPKVVYIVNPNNPTGTLHAKDDLKKIIENHSDILFIVDEAYYEFSSETVSDLTTTNENLIVSRTFSKAFALASFRIGYAISHPNNIQVINKIRNPKNVSLFAQVAAIQAIGDIQYTLNYVAEVNKTQIKFIEELNNLNFLKATRGGGNFVFIEFSQKRVKEDFIKFLESNNIFIRDYGHISQTEMFARITIGTENQMSKVLGVIKEFSV